MIRAVLVLALVARLAAQGSDALFTVKDDGGRPVVSANRAAVACDVALQDLAAVIGWTVRFPSGGLRERLSNAIVDLSIVDRSPHLVAGSIAAAAGAEIVVVEHGGGRTGSEIAVVDLPDPGTEPGRERLRSWALDWYRHCLAERVREGLDGDDEGLRVRMHMADLMSKRGDYRDAAALLEQVRTLAPDHEYVPQALLRMAHCWFELGPDSWTEAERRARDLMRLHPARPEAAAGTVLLGRILLAGGRAAECVDTLESAYLRLSDAPEIVDVYLLVGLASQRLGDAASVVRILATLAGGHDVSQLRGGQLADHLFLTGYAAQRRGMPRRAIRALERWFAVAAADDEHRGEAFVLLGEAYFGDGRYLQARAAAIHARRHAAQLDRESASAAARLFASTALALGDEDRSLRELEAEIRRDPAADGELTLFLADLFHSRGRHSRCVDLIDPLLARTDPLGDRARRLAIGALFDQARETDSYEAFLGRAPALATAISSTELQQQAAELIGQAFEASGDLARAADAYRGVLR